MPWSGVTTNHSTSPFAEEMYEKSKDTLIEYEVVINRWPHYSLVLENVSSKLLKTVSLSILSFHSQILHVPLMCKDVDIYNHRQCISIDIFTLVHIYINHTCAVELSQLLTLSKMPYSTFGRLLQMLKGRS